MHHKKMTSPPNSGNPALLRCPDTESNPHLAQKEGAECSFKISVSPMAVFLALSKQVKNLPRSKMSKVATPTTPQRAILAA